MATAIGLLELKSIPIGIKSADEMLKAAQVRLLLAAPSCPGKYLIIVSGQVGAVKSAMTAGLQEAGVYLVASHVINNVHQDVPAAIIGTAEIGNIRSLAVIESISALTAVMAADIAAKAANVRLMEVRLARGLGGKGFVIFTGEVAAVNAAVKSCQNELASSGEITGTCVIPSPHPGLIEQLLQ